MIIFLSHVIRIVAAFQILLCVYGHMDWNAPQPTGDCHEEKNAYYKNQNHQFNWWFAQAL